MVTALQDLTVIHRLCFAARSIPTEVPYYWEIIRDFGIKGKDLILSANDCRVFVENLKVIHEGVFESDTKLTTELMRTAKNDTKSPERIGIILVSPNMNCHKCGLRLYIRPDRSASAIVYDYEMGTLPAIHYTRYCRKKAVLFNSIMVITLAAVQMM